MAIHGSGLLDIDELKTLDHRYYRYADPAKAGKDIVLVAVDEASLEAFGRWPWPRDRHGYVVHYLKEAGAKAIVFDILFLEPDEDSEEFDRAFAEEVRAAGNVFLPILFQDSPQSFPPELLSKAAIRVEDKSNESGRISRTIQGSSSPFRRWRSQLEASGSSICFLIRTGRRAGYSCSLRRREQPFRRSARR